ncbi:hypothetical protein EZS27_033637, partial [termite gut metagenome]
MELSTYFRINADNSAVGILSQVYHFGTCISLLVVVCYGNAVKLCR